MNYNQLTNEDQIINWINKNPNTDKINQKDNLGNHILDWVFNGYRGKDSNKLNICRIIINSTDIKELQQDTIERIFLTTMLDNANNKNQNKIILDKLERYNILKQDDIESNLIINSINNAKTYHELSQTEKELIIKNSNKNIKVNDINEKNLLHPVIYCSLNVSKSFNIFKNLNYLYDYQARNLLNFQEVIFESQYFNYVCEDVRKILDVNNTKHMNDFFEQIMDLKDGTQDILNDIVKKSRAFQLEKMLQTKGIVHKNKI